MTPKIILVTGATDGIGKQTASDLAHLGHHVIVHGRDRDRSLEAISQIRERTPGGKLDDCYADFSSLEEIRGMTGRLKEKYDHIDVLINNAGIFENEFRLSVDGYEMTFAVNQLSYFLLTLSLLDLLEKAEQGRIINVSSLAHSNSPPFDPGKIKAEKEFSPYDAHAPSKLANVMFTYDLAEKLVSTDITVNCLHPGVIRSKLLFAGFGIGGSDPEEGAKTSVYLATDHELRRVTGKYYSIMNETSSSAYSQDRDARDAMWKLCEEATGISY